jgi:hypothetical protein
MKNKGKCLFELIAKYKKKINKKTSHKLNLIFLCLLKNQVANIRDKTIAK